jgi:hypothetical protein
LDQLQQPGSIERLLEDFARHSGLLPEGARRVRKQAVLPKELQGIVSRAIAHPWVAFSSGSRYWLFTGVVSIARSRLRKAPVLQVNSYDEGGAVIDTGAWSAERDGQWQRVES